MIELHDQIGHLLRLKKTPQRIVSLVPSQTEYLADLGLQHEVVGLTKFCVHPSPWRKEKTIIGGTKKLHLDKIKALNPDLIIANKEENNKEDILELQKNYLVYTSDIFTLPESFKMMEDIGLLCGKEKEARFIIETIQNSFNTIKPQKNSKVAYVIWNNPLMLAGKKTYINTMLTLAGLENVLTSEGSRYPEIAIDELIEMKPDLIFLSSEPFPFKEKHRLKIEAQTDIKTVLVDGEVFSWYGSRMLNFAGYINQLKRLK